MGTKLIISVISMITAIFSGWGAANHGIVPAAKPKPTAAVTASPAPTAARTASPTSAPAQTASPASTPVSASTAAPPPAPASEATAAPVYIPKQTSAPTRTVTVNISSVYLSFASLSDTEKALYAEMCAYLEAGMLEFTFYDTDENAVINAYKAVTKDHPEYFWVNGGYSYTKTTSSAGTSVEFKPAVMTSSINEIEYKKQALESYVDRLTSIQQGISDYDKLLYIHDYIVDNTDYDYYASSINQQGVILNASTAYGCLAEHKAVCSGYSAAFQLLAQRLGIPCGRVSGYKSGGGSHEWNYVLLDGEYYYIDVTWDDPSSENKSISDNKTYEFFCITSSELDETHRINDGQFAPLCTSERYNYYVYNDLYVPYYSYPAVSRILSRHYGEDIAIKFADKAEAQRAAEDLLGGNTIFEFTDKTSITYSTGVTGKVLTLYLK